MSCAGHPQLHTPNFDRVAKAGVRFTRAYVAERGFDAWLRDDGLWGEGHDGSYDSGNSAYNENLQAKGYRASNPWLHDANAGVATHRPLRQGD